MAFQFIDDFTGPDFGSPGKCPGRQHRGNGIDGRLVWPYPAVHSRTNMHDMGKAEYIEIFFHVDAAKFTDTSQIVPPQIDEHRPRSPAA